MLSLSEWNSILSFVITAATMIFTVGTGVWWLSGQFSKMRHLMDDKIDKLESNIIQKFEYHEQHDDARFNQLGNDVWQLRLENAAREGKVKIAKRDDLVTTNQHNS